MSAPTDFNSGWTEYACVATEAIKRYSVQVKNCGRAKIERAFFRDVMLNDRCDFINLTKAVARFGNGHLVQIRNQRRFYSATVPNVILIGHVLAVNLRAFFSSDVLGFAINDFSRNALVFNMSVSVCKTAPMFLFFFRRELAKSGSFQKHL